MRSSRPITGPDASIPGGLIVILTLFVLNRGVAVLRVRSSFVRRLLEFGPTVVGRDGAWLFPVLDGRAWTSWTWRRRCASTGSTTVKELKLATLEADGSISIVAIDSAGSTGARRRRTRSRRPI